jgi:hypothetical protein
MHSVKWPKDTLLHTILTIHCQEVGDLGLQRTTDCPSGRYVNKVCQDIQWETTRQHSGSQPDLVSLTRPGCKGRLFQISRDCLCFCDVVGFNICCWVSCLGSRIGVVLYQIAHLGVACPPLQGLCWLFVSTFAVFYPSTWKCSSWRGFGMGWV